MSELRRRFDGMVSKYGEPFEVAGNPRFGIFGILPPSVAGRYVTQAILDLVNRPIRSIYVTATDATEESDIVDWNGADWLVRRVVPIRYSRETVAKLLVITEGI